MTNKAKYLGIYKGRKVYRFPVEGKVESLIGNELFCVVEKDWVTSYTTVEAANHFLKYMMEKWERPVDVTAYGIRGGKYHRYAGWYSVIAHSIMRPRGIDTPRQGVLSFVLD